MTRLASFFRSEIPARRHEVVVVEVPDEGRPRVVQHPLNHARRCVFVPSIGFEHGSLAAVSHSLRLALVIIERRRRSPAPVQTIRKTLTPREPLAPPLITRHSLHPPN